MCHLELCDFSINYIHYFVLSDDFLPIEIFSSIALITLDSCYRKMLSELIK